MRRREFLQKTAVAAGAASGAVTLASAAAAPAHTFKLKYAPHFGMFKVSGGGDLFDQLRFMADAGFRALEDNGLMARSVDVQQRIGDTLAKAGMTMGVFVIDAGDNWKVSLTTGKPEFRERFVKACHEAVNVAKRCQARWMTVVPGYFDREQRIGVQTGHVIDALRAGADVLAPHGLVMVLEPLSDNPDLFLRTADQAYEICRAVNSPACKILFDMYHLQQNQGSIIASIDQVWSEIGYFQIGDVPGRLWPGTGEMNYGNIFKHISTKMRQTGRDFIFGMEHGPWQPDKAGERACIQS